MTPFVTFITYVISAGIVLLDVFIIFSFIFFVISLFNKEERKRIPESKKGKFFSRWGLVIALFIAIGSLITSLFYSEIAGFIACPLCVWQRIFFYPQILILLIPFFNSSRSSMRGVWWSVLALSVIGAGLALFHYYGQVGNASVLPCDATTGQSACALIPFKTFGYITIPMMSLTGFLTQISLLLWYKLGTHES